MRPRIAFGKHFVEGPCRLQSFGLTGDTPAATGTLEGNARSGFVKSVYSFKTDLTNVPDDF